MNHDLMIDVKLRSGELYDVSNLPAKLGGCPASHLKEKDRASKASQAGYVQVACLLGESCDACGRVFPHPSLKRLIVADMEDQACKSRPSNPESEFRILSDVVEACVSALYRGEGVLVHCLGGTGRTGTVIAAVLKSMGASFNDVIDTMHRVNMVRGRRQGWPESNWQRSIVERF